jgi:hypothetical protein
MTVIADIAALTDATTSNGPAGDLIGSNNRNRRIPRTAANRCRARSPTPCLPHGRALRAGLGRHRVCCGGSDRRSPTSAVGYAHYLATPVTSRPGAPARMRQRHDHRLRRAAGTDRRRRPWRRRPDRERLRRTGRSHHPAPHPGRRRSPRLPPAAAPIRRRAATRPHPAGPQHATTRRPASPRHHQSRRPTPSNPRDRVHHLCHPTAVRASYGAHANAYVPKPLDLDDFDRVLTRSAPSTATPSHFHAAAQNLDPPTIA